MVVGILGVQLCLVSAGWRLCCAFEVCGDMQLLYPMTGWEGAGAREPPLGGSKQAVSYRAWPCSADVRLAVGAPLAQNGFNLHQGLS